MAENEHDVIHNLHKISITLTLVAAISHPSKGFFAIKSLEKHFTSNNTVGTGTAPGQKGKFVWKDGRMWENKSGKRALTVMGGHCFSIKIKL